MTERERQQQDARLDALVDEVAWAASRYGEAKARHWYGDHLATASDAMQEAVDRLHEYIAELRQPAPAGEDTARLDWLEALDDGATWDALSVSRSVRAAIDAARGVTASGDVGAP